MATFSTDIFKPSARIYAKSYVRHTVATWGFVVSLPFVAAFFAGFFDIRWWLVGLMLLMIAYPAFVLFAWLAITSRPHQATMVRPQRWTFADDGSIEINFYPFEHNDDTPPAKTLRIPRHLINSFVTDTKLCRFKLSDKDMPFILIEISLLPPHIISQYER